MWKPKRTIKKIALTIIPIILLSLFYFSFASANEQSDIEKEYDSIYRYNALENKNFFAYSIDDSEIILIEKLPENIITVTNADKLEYITKKQASSIEKSDNAISLIENRRKFGTFVFGNKLGILKYQMVQMKDQSHVLYMLLEDAEDVVIENQINSQVDVLALQQTKVENFILKQKDAFSLFGWFLSSL